MQADQLGVPAFSADDEAFADDMLRAMLSEGEDPQDPRQQAQQQPSQLAQQAQFAPQQQQLLQQQQQLAAQQQQQAQLRDPYQQQHQQAPPRYQQPQDPSLYGGPALSTFIPDPSAELHRQVRLQAPAYRQSLNGAASKSSPYEGSKCCA